MKKCRVSVAVIVAILSILLVTAVIGAFDEQKEAQRVLMTPLLQTNSPFGEIADWMVTGPENAMIGEYIEGVGDVNGDGFDDFAHARKGFATVDLYYGSATGLPISTSLTMIILNPEVKPGGDFNDDGFDDFIVKSGYTPLYVYYGSSFGPSNPVSYTLAADPMAGNWLEGYGIGDYNGDNIDDFLLVDTRYDTDLGHPTYDDHGSAWVYLGTTNGISSTASMQIKGKYNGGRLGRSGSTLLGDINQDGYDDFALLEERTDVVPSVTHIEVFYGREVPSSIPSADWIFVDDTPNINTKLVGGDFNGDGFSDLIVGDGRYTNGELQEGRVTAFYGSSNGLNSIPDWSYESNTADYFMGHLVDNAGDVNDDGYDDLVLGVYSYLDSHGAYLFLGSSVGLGSQFDWTYTRQSVYMDYGISPACGIGDVNGDGAGDIAIGFTEYDAEPPIGSNPQRHGAIFSFYGTPSEVEAITGLSIVRAGDTLTATHDTGGELIYTWDYSLKSVDCAGDSTASVVPTCSAEMWVSLTATNGAYTETITGVYEADLSLTP